MNMVVFLSGIIFNTFVLNLAQFSFSFDFTGLDALIKSVQCKLSVVVFVQSTLESLF